MPFAARFEGESFGRDLAKALVSLCGCDRRVMSAYHTLVHSMGVDMAMNSRSTVVSITDAPRNNPKTVSFLKRDVNQRVQMARVKPNRLLVVVSS